MWVALATIDVGIQKTQSAASAAGYSSLAYLLSDGALAEDIGGAAPKELC
jgi:hypothetical protein